MTRTAATTPPARAVPAHAGDFFTSVDVGPLFGEMVAVQLAEMWPRMDAGGALDLVEAGAGDGRLTRDILDALATEHPNLYDRLHVTLVERSDPARRAAATTLHAHAARVEDIRAGLPERIRGVLLANELLDALPVHVLVKTTRGLRSCTLQRQGEEVRASAGAFVRPPAGRACRDAEALAVGWRAERSLAVPDWIASAAASLERGFLLLFDYVQADALYPTLHAGGLFGRTPPLGDGSHAPGTRDLTSHVDLDQRCAAAAAACGLVDAAAASTRPTSSRRSGSSSGCRQRQISGSLARRLGAKMLMLPGGLGSTMKVIGFASRVDGAGTARVLAGSS